MDPITQGIFGGVFAQTLVNKKKIFYESIVGVISGLAPDLDVLIRSETDPLLSLEYHRQFSHSLIFIPIGALFVSLITHMIFKRKISFSQNYLCSIIGFSTHGFLDACTSYGTQLFWPFSNYRVSFNNISIIDPILTIPILLFFLLALRYKIKIFTFVAVFWIAFYLSFGIFMRNQAFEASKKLINQRGHSAQDLTVKPSFGNIFLWKIIYFHEDYYYIDAVNLIGNKKYCIGKKIPKFTIKKFYKGLNPASKQISDIDRFSWFSQGYLGYDIKRDIITDIRYSMLPNDTLGLWGIRLNKDLNYTGHVEWITNREINRVKRQLFFKMLFENECNTVL